MHLGEGVPGTENVRVAPKDRAAFLLLQQSLKLVAPHCKHRLQIPKSSIKNGLFSGHKVLAVNMCYFRHTTWSRHCSEEDPACKCWWILGCQPVNTRSRNIGLIVRQVEFWCVCTSHRGYLCMCLASWLRGNLSDFTGLQLPAENRVLHHVKPLSKCRGGLSTEPRSLILVPVQTRRARTSTSELNCTGSLPREVRACKFGMNRIFSDRRGNGETLIHCPLVQSTSEVKTGFEV